MSAPTSTAGDLGFVMPPTPSEPLWPLTVGQYHDMLRGGILTKDHPVELLDGLLVTKMPKNPAHRLAGRLLREALEAILPSGWFVESQEPITLARSEPEPDITVIRGKPTDFAKRHPAPADIGLVVEIADTTVERDRNWKNRLYAEAGIGLYWLVNLRERNVTVFSDPLQGPQALYGKTVTYSPGGAHLLLVLDGQQAGEIDLNSFLVA